jgi:hypothetical protein
MPLIVRHPSTIPRRYQRVLDLLRQRPQTDLGLAEELMLTPRAARHYIYELCRLHGYTIESDGSRRSPVTYTLLEEAPESTP